MSKIEIKRLYLVNKIDTSVIMKGGYITAPRGGYATITENDLTHPDVEDAVTKEWVEVWDKAPTADSMSGLPAAPVPIEISNPYEGMTEAELKASNEPTTEEVEVVEPAGKPATKKAKAAETKE